MEPFFEPTKWGEEFQDNLRCRQCEKVNAVYFIHLTDNETEHYCKDCIVNREALSSQGLTLDKDQICDSCETSSKETLAVQNIDYSGAGITNHCKDCSRKIIQIIEDLGGIFLDWDEQKAADVYAWIRTKEKIIPKRNPISLPFRHEALKRAKYRCLECGATKEETTLHVDHIIPVSQGGSDELVNLQALCKECNKAKYNRVWEAGK